VPKELGDCCCLSFTFWSYDRVLRACGTRPMSMSCCLVEPEAVELLAGGDAIGDGARELVVVQPGLMEVVSAGWIPFKRPSKVAEVDDWAAAQSLPKYLEFFLIAFSQNEE